MWYQVPILSQSHVAAKVPCMPVFLEFLSTSSPPFAAEEPILKMRTDKLQGSYEATGRDMEDYPNLRSLFRYAKQ